MLIYIAYITKKRKIYKKLVGMSLQMSTTGI